MEHMDLIHKEIGDNWTQQGGADNRTQVKCMTIIMKRETQEGKENQDNTPGRTELNSKP